MAEPSEGAYALINVATQKALDVYWTKKSGYQNWAANNARNESWHSQTWILDNQSDGWQITNSITWKCLDASDTSKRWGQVLSDNNKNSQRWTVATDSKTATYGGKTYDTYTLKPKNATTYSLSAQSDGWIKLVNNTTSNNARWILVPLTAITNSGLYKIIPAEDLKKSLEIASGSTDNEAAAKASTTADKEQQVFRALVNAETGAVKLINVKSGKALDIWTNSKGTPNKVAQYTLNSSWTSSASQSQQWLITKVPNGSAKLNGSSVPTYSLRSEKYTGYGLAMKGTSVTIASYSPSSKSQQFIFVKTELLGTKLTTPGGIINTLFAINGAGTAKATQLQFRSTYEYFQARYKVRRYVKGRKSYKDSAWMNAKKNGTANEGWGDAWTYSFHEKPSSGIVTMSSMTFSEKLSTSDCIAADLIFQIRPYTTNYQNKGYNAHGSYKQSTVKLRIKPTVDLKSFNMVMAAGKSAKTDQVGIRAIFTDSLGEGCSNIRARIIGADNIPISDWAQSSTMTLDFMIGGVLHRLPNQNEKVKLSYSFVSKYDDVVRNGDISHTFTYTSAGNIPIGHSMSTDGSLAALIKAPRHTADCCFMEIKFLSGTKLIPCKYYKTANNEIIWQAVSPLNKDTKIHVYSMGTKATQVLHGETTIRVDSHGSIWNWGSSSSANYTQFATLIVNPDVPPQQKRAFTADAQFHTPAGRVLPVSFASKALSIDLSVAGVSIDQDAKYYAPEPLPPHGEVEYLIQLAELSGRGIHPIYRTPYGDWYQVAISSVDVSKNNLNYSDVSISQRAMED